jgi:hypothetical protein
MSDESGSVFPIERKEWVPASANDPRGHEFIERANGLTKREWMIGQVAACGSVLKPAHRTRTDSGPTTEQQYAREVIRAADAIMAGLEHG